VTQEANDAVANKRRLNAQRDPELERHLGNLERAVASEEDEDGGAKAFRFVFSIGLWAVILAKVYACGGTSQKGLEAFTIVACVPLKGSMWHFSRFVDAALCAFVSCIAASAVLQFWRTEVFVRWRRCQLRMEICGDIIDEHDAATHGLQQMPLTTPSDLGRWFAMRLWLQIEAMPMDLRLAVWPMSIQLLFVSTVLALLVSFVLVTDSWNNEFTYFGGYLLLSLIFLFLSTVSAGVLCFRAQQEHDDCLSQQEVLVCFRELELQAALCSEPPRQLVAEGGGGAGGSLAPVTLTPAPTLEQKQLGVMKRAFDYVSSITDRHLCYCYLLGFRVDEGLQKVIFSSLLSTLVFAASHYLLHQ